MKKVLSILSILLALAVLLCACAGEPEPTTVPITEPTTVPTTEPTSEPTTEPTTEPTAEPTTEPTELDPATPPEGPRQAGERLTEEELEKFNALFALGGDRFSRMHKNYYNYALSPTYDSPQNYPLSRFFNGGFSNEHDEPITDEEAAFYNNAKGYTEDSPMVPNSNLERLPRVIVEWYVEYYFGLPLEEMGASSMVYNPETDCYYIFCSDTAAYIHQGFHDGYYDPETGMISLYYNHYALPREMVITIQSKRDIGEDGYYIISNVVVREWHDSVN